MQNLLTGYCDCRQFVTQAPPLPPPLPMNSNPQTLCSPAAFIFSMSGSLVSAPSICSARRSLPRGTKYELRAASSPSAPHPVLSMLSSSSVQMEMLNGKKKNPNTSNKNPTPVSLKILFLISNCGRVLLSSLFQRKAGRFGG